MQDIIRTETPESVSKSVLNASSPDKINDDVSTPDSSVPSRSKMCYTMQFSFEELKKKRQQKLAAAFQASKHTRGISKTKGFETVKILW